MKTKNFLFILTIFANLSYTGFAQSSTDSTNIDASAETFTPNFEKVSPKFEQFLEQNTLDIKQKTKDYYVIRYTLIMSKSQFAEFKNKLEEWNCQTITLSETTKFIPEEKAEKNQNIEN